MNSDLIYYLTQAKFIRFDPNHQFFLTWRGCTCITAYALGGHEVGYWKIEGTARAPTLEQVQASMQEHIDAGYYPPD